MAVRSVFISSVQRDFGDVRRAAADALESLGLHPLMAERTGASPESPQRALLGLVEEADLFLLLLAANYGEPGVSGFSPTEEELNEARRLREPTVVLVQETKRELAQQAFLARVRGGWEAGVLYGAFTDATDVGAAVVRAFGRLLTGASGEDAAAAAQRARDLAPGTDRSANMRSGSVARAAFVPTRSETLLDVVALDDAQLGNDLASVARAADLIGHEFGIETKISAGGVALTATGGRSWIPPSVTVSSDGTVVAEGGAHDDDLMGGMVFSEDRVLEFVAAAARFAQAAWDRIDRHGVIRNVAVGFALLDASMKGWRSHTSSPSTSMSLGGQVPSTLVVPAADFVVARGELAAPDTRRRLVLEAKRFFIDAGRVQ